MKDQRFFRCCRRVFWIHHIFHSLSPCLDLSAAIPFNEVFDFLEHLICGWFSSTSVKLINQCLLGCRQNVRKLVWESVAMPDIFACRKAAIAALPKTEKARVAKSKSTCCLEFDERFKKASTVRRFFRTVA